MKEADVPGQTSVGFEGFARANKVGPASTDVGPESVPDARPVMGHALPTKAATAVRQPGDQVRAVRQIFRAKIDIIRRITNPVRVAGTDRSAVSALRARPVDNAMRRTWGARSPRVLDLGEKVNPSFPDLRI